MKKIAFLFPGQGSQYVGMGKNLAENHLIAGEVFEAANDALGFDLKQLCFNGDIAELTKTENTQPAILTASVAAFRVYMKEFGIEPVYLAGHSLGEISALTCAGGIEFKDAIRIVRQRGKLMQEAVPQGLGAMAAISGVDRAVVEAECGKHTGSDQLVVVSNYNSPEQIVISGHSAAVKVAGENLKQSGAKVIPLKVSAPFHSPLMQQAADKLVEELRKYKYSGLKWKVMSNVTAAPYESSDRIIENLVLQIVKPVKWQESMKFLESNGIEMVIELGPQTVLKNLMKKNIPGIESYSFDKEEDIKVLRDKLLKGDDPVKNMGGKLIIRCMAIAICTKNNNWDNEEYRKGVIEPYKKVKQMQEELEQAGREPSLDQMKEALNMLNSVFNTKRTPINVQKERFDQLFAETGLKDLFHDPRFPA